MKLKQIKRFLAVVIAMALVLSPSLIVRAEDNLTHSEEIVKFSNDLKLHDLKDERNYGELIMKVEPKESISKIESLMVNNAQYSTVSSKATIWNGNNKYFADVNSGVIYMIKPSDSSIIKVIMDDGTEKAFIFKEKKQLEVV